MSYHHSFITRIRQRPASPGVLLAAEAINLGVSVAQLAKAMGASRQTVYNWMDGGEILAPYRSAVERSLECLLSAKDADDAWRKLCTEFNLEH